MSASGTTGNAMRLGANRLADGRWEFLLWAPKARSVSLHLLHSGELLTMAPVSRGYFRRTVENLEPGTRYFFQLDGARELPDPASRFQPEGVHGPSEVVDLNQFQWTDQNWQGRTLERSIFYEIHVGTYTAQGTFDALISHIPELVELGITTVELMPVAQFPGSRNWGYDGVYPFAPQNSYGGPEPLQRFVNAAHEQGLSVALDVVYNHLGPEGNYLNAYGPYFTDRYRTPWGQALNFDGAGSDEVRRFFIENALYWLENYHFDALRLDAVHGIFDFSARHFLTEIKNAVGALAKRLGRMIHCIAESDLNDSRLLLNHEQGGYDLDAQWSDDFHHSVHRLLTGEDRGYYADFGGIGPLAATLRDGWYYQRTVFAVSATTAWQLTPGHSRFAGCGMQSESRSGWQSRCWRATKQPGKFRITETRSRNHAAFAVRPSAVYGRRVWRNCAIPILHQSWRSGVGRGSASGTT